MSHCMAGVVVPSLRITVRRPAIIYLPLSPNPIQPYKINTNNTFSSSWPLLSRATGLALHALPPYTEADERAVREVNTFPLSFC